jgi:hypothetical protein
VLRTSPQNREAQSLAHPHSTTDPYKLWAVWGVIAVLALGLFVASIPAYVLTFGKAAWFGAPVEAPAEVVFALDLLGVLASIAAVLVCLTLAGMLFWRKSDDWMVMFISSYLLAYGVVLAGPLERA